MSRTSSILCLLVALAASLPFVVSCGSASIADAASAMRAPAPFRHELSLVQADGTRHEMEVYGWSHEVVSPRDAASGLPTGKRQHKPFTVTKPVDKATPLLMQALVSNEVFESCILSSYRVQGGREELYRTVALTTPWVSTRATAGDTRDGSGDHEDREHVSFTYQKIVWTWEDGGITAEDDWETPVALRR